MLLALGILLLLFEVIKGARPGAKYLTDHLLSLIVFGAAAAEFVLWPKFGTSTYFLLALLALVDFLSGLALRTRRGAVAAPAPAVSSKSARKAEPPVAEPQFEPRPRLRRACRRRRPSVPAAASVAESVLLDHPEPTPRATRRQSAASCSRRAQACQPRSPRRSAESRRKSRSRTAGCAADRRTNRRETRQDELKI